MRLIHLPLAAAAFFIGLSISIAPAQQASDPRATIRIKSQQNAKEEPGSHAARPSTDVFVNGKLVVPGAPAESQTEPAKFSEKNAQARRRADHGQAARPERRAEAPHRRERDAVQRAGRADQRQAGRRPARHHASLGIFRRPEGGRSGDRAISPSSAPATRSCSYARRT